MFRSIWRGIIDITSFVLWIIERIITRSGFIWVAYFVGDLLYTATKQLFSEKLIGTTYYIAEADRISGGVLWRVIGLCIGLLFVALITQPIGEFIEAIIDMIQGNHHTSQFIDNVKAGKMLFFIWTLFAITVGLVNFINLHEYSILFVVIIFAIDLAVGWFVLVLTFNLEPDYLLIIWFLLLDGFGGSGGSGSSKNVDVYIHIKGRR